MAESEALAKRGAEAIPRFTLDKSRIPKEMWDDPRLLKAESTAGPRRRGFWYSFGTVMTKMRRTGFRNGRKCFRISIASAVGV